MLTLMLLMLTMDISKETNEANMTKILNKYINGDYTFTIYSDGTLVRETDVENPKVIHPSSIDVKVTDYCDMGCAYCFTPDMNVLTINDNKKIIDIKVGEKVYSLNEKTNQVEVKSILDKFIKTISEDIFIFELENKKFIKCTGDHKLYIKNKGWVEAKNILETDILDNIF